MLYVSIVFDKVYHEQWLTAKEAQVPCGIVGKPCTRIKEFLTNRRQIVTADRVHPEPTDVSGGPLRDCTESAAVSA